MSEQNIKLHVEVPDPETGLEDFAAYHDMTRAIVDEYSTHEVFNHGGHRKALIAVVRAALPFLVIRPTSEDSSTPESPPRKEK